MPTYRKNSEAVSKLTPEQYLVTQIGCTEAPFRQRILGQQEPGLYVDVVSGEPLFASFDKFDSRDRMAEFHAAPRGRRTSSRTLTSRPA